MSDLLKTDIQTDGGTTPYNNTSPFFNLVYNKRPMGHIAHLSTASLRRAVVAIVAPLNPRLGGGGGGGIKSTPYQEAFR